MYGNYAFPTGYQPAVNPYQPNYQQTYQQNYQQPVQQVQQANNFQNPPAGNSLTPPTIHAEIIQIDGGHKEVENYPVNAGCSQMFMTKDDKTIFIKSVYANGQYTIVEYPQKEPEPEKETNVLENYVTLDMLEQRLSEITSSFRNQAQNANSNQSFKKPKVRDESKNE